MRLIFGGNEEAEACGKECPGHLREGEEEESATAEGIDCPQGWEGEDEIDEAETERGEEGANGGSSSLGEDSRGVESDDIDATPTACC